MMTEAGRWKRRTEEGAEGGQLRGLELTPRLAAQRGDVLFPPWTRLARSEREAIIAVE
jgi:hypothetical protein